MLVSALMVGLMVGLMVDLLGCGGSRAVLEPYGFSELGLLDFQSYAFALRYTTADGLPISAAAISCRISGDGGGALLQQPLAQTDSEGIVRFALETRGPAVFALRCRPVGHDPSALSFPVRVR
ncbi:MAG: hypothetical protein IPL40_14485 [Proteobacteria bacterium]|nr:hypothetical protein [Pseudomonadota bacterium]